MKLHFPGALFLAAVLAAGVSAQISFNTCVGPPTSDYCGAGGACELPDGSLLCCDGAINCGGNGVCMAIELAPRLGEKSVDDDEPEPTWACSVGGPHDGVKNEELRERDEGEQKRNIDKAVEEESHRKHQTSEKVKLRCAFTG
ncbi:uncharacterized protein PV07_10006 [Cladophialophora immunda]|uniref:Uncharacterized protein n=1 Tax=Cladophialophora immunda TaxID=569365 RepID=A0A0D2CL34_9EURO|nr:uncharacterized protein PV07_10006 [Cladophialophora immunda]KIW24279.1 hypothetical protein PV07_10006 [Cladophialophora immunda]